METPMAFRATPGKVVEKMQQAPQHRIGSAELVSISPHSVVGFFQRIS